SKIFHPNKRYSVKNTHRSHIITEIPNTQRFFTCVDYSPSSQFLMTGGADGCLRVLYPGISKLLRCRSQSFVALRIPVFTDDCKDIRYFPELRSFAVCGRSSSMMVLVELPSGCYGFSQKVSKRCFNSPNTQRFFTCVDYSPSSQFLMTGGADGCLRVLYPGISKSSSIAKKLTGHTRPITHLAYNLREKIFISVSEDKNIRVWKDGTWVCLQSFYIYACICYHGDVAG
uniref:WD repeat-containing protein on Y chromosome n=1 Tax=Amphiprion percula TaxID=161767 RepID=A0A3P8S4F2_AMPPE